MLERYLRAAGVPHWEGIPQRGTSAESAHLQIATARFQDLALTVSFLNEAAVRVDAGAALLGLLLSQPQDVLQAIQGHLNYLRVHDGQKITQGFNAAQVY